MIEATVNSATTTSAYRGDGLRDSRAVSGGATTQFTWDIASGLPVVLDDGNQYVHGAGLSAMKQSGNGAARPHNLPTSGSQGSEMEARVRQCLR
ncbi:MAG: hypothetical protein IPI33_05495 [Dehalococcoidia bacterium]|nr:hypothetical protein [Dehalococcoidia bacterium]